MTDKPLSITQCLAAVSAESNVSYREMISAHRSRYVARPRQIAMWLAFRYGARNYSEIGRLIGNRDHTTIMHGVRQIEKLRAEGDQRVIELSNAALRRVLADPRQPELAI
jgi:chromosomal replication initiator protein